MIIWRPTSGLQHPGQDADVPMDLEYNEPYPELHHVGREQYSSEKTQRTTASRGSTPGGALHHHDAEPEEDYRYHHHSSPLDITQEKTES